MNEQIQQFSFEKELWSIGRKFIAGVDEAGRGPVAGPVIAAAVIFPETVFIAGIDDSKKLSPYKREYLQPLGRQAEEA